jgi:hypothetical protein
MNTCDAVRKRIAELARSFQAEVPDWVREHAAACRQCGRRLAAARLVRVVVESGAKEVEPSPGFAHRIAVSIFRQAAARPTEAGLWRPAWGLVPAFGAVVVALLIVFQGSLTPEPTGMFMTEGLSTGEHLVLGSSAPNVDMLLAAVLEGEGK